MTESFAAMNASRGSTSSSSSSVPGLFAAGRGVSSSSSSSSAMPARSSSASRVQPGGLRSDTPGASSSSAAPGAGAGAGAAAAAARSRRSRICAARSAAGSFPFSAAGASSFRSRGWDESSSRAGWISAVVAGVGAGSSVRRRLDDAFSVS